MALISTAAAAVPASFAPSVAYPTGAGTAPGAVAIADFDGDGALDLAVACGNTGEVKILPGRGDGSFDPVVLTLRSGAGPVAIAAADLTHDGHPDLVVANMTAGNLSVFVSTGNGFGFFPAIPVALSGTAPAPSALVVGKFDADNVLDLAVADTAANRVDVLVGKGDGTFSAGDVLFFQPHPTAIATADLNHDGKSDLVVARREITGAGTAAIFLAGHGSSLFHGFGSIGTVDQPTAIAARDVNGDGVPDIIVTGGGANRVVVLTGEGDGTFNPPVRFGTGKTPQGLAIDDLNQDGAPDIITANQGDRTVSVLVGTGNGSFNPAQTFPVGQQPQAVAVVDLNDDSYPDIVTADSGDDSVSVLLNLSGIVTPPTPTPIVGPVIAVGGAIASAGQPAVIAVSLQSNGAAVVGVQNDIDFDPTRVTLDPNHCEVNPALGKDLSKSLRIEDSTHARLRAIVLSFGDVVPIPDGTVYTCTFDVLETTAPGTYPLVARAAVASDVHGDAIAGATASDGAIVVVMPTVTPSATATATRFATPSPTTTATATPSTTQTATATETLAATITQTATQTVTSTQTEATQTATATASPSLSPTSTGTVLPPSCVGDCDRQGTVSVDELVLAVNISLGNDNVAQCRAADPDASGHVTVDELVLAVNNSLNGCSP